MNQSKVLESKIGRDVNCRSYGPFHRRTGTHHDVASTRSVVSIFQGTHLCLGFVSEVQFHSLYAHVAAPCEQKRGVTTAQKILRPKEAEKCDDSAHRDMFEVLLLKSQTDSRLFIQNSILLVKIPSRQRAVRPCELYFWHLLAQQQGSGSQACHHSKEHVHTALCDFNILDASALGAIMYI